MHVIEDNPVLRLPLVPVCQTFHEHEIKKDKMKRRSSFTIDLYSGWRSGRGLVKGGKALMFKETFVISRNAEKLIR